MAPVGAVVAVIAGAGEAAKPKAAEVPKGAPPPPVFPRKRGPRAQRRQGPARAWTSGCKCVTCRSALDPFLEVRTPERNYGPAQLSGGTFITPLARRLAGEAWHRSVAPRGSGPHGRIVAADVEKAAPAAPRDGDRRQRGAGQSAIRGHRYEEVPLDGMRATIAKRLVEAKQTIPHFYLTADLDVGRLVAVREEANAAAPKGEDGVPAFKLSLNDFIIRAWAAALQRIPAANAVWAGDRILRFAHSDIGIAVAIDGGLITPVVRNAETKVADRDIG